ncbi:hypothetical protein KC19_2G069900 [Ceratodon purpureus]|uniref:Chalcone synthase n=1 Tax=Ceratodon purpureus TaxID=3225 RepID=A0A8T0ISM7_CERPU|nr:hypothetical protein KC19_2G069900 [Ceratodon purpureus]
MIGNGSMGVLTRTVWQATPRSCEYRHLVNIKSKEPKTGGSLKRPGSWNQECFRNNCLNMASPAEQVLSTGSLETLRTEDQRKHVDHAPANLSSSCILGLGTANPTGKALGIVQKQMAFSPEIYQKHPSLKVYKSPNLGERFNIYEPEAMNIGKQAAERALADWGGDRADITHLISYSTTMLLSPSLDLRLVKCLNLQATVKHYSVSLLGCYGGVNGIRTAAEIAQADPTSRILVVFVEINSAAAQTVNPDNPFADLGPVVSNLAFGDGAGAVVVGKCPTVKEDTVFEVHRSESYLIPNTEDCVTARLLPSGLHSTQEKNYPAHVGQNTGGFIDQLLRDTNLTYVDVNWAVSSGGKPVLDTIEKNCKLNDNQLQVSRHILRNYGNMGAATILFVLNKFRSDKKEDETILVNPWTVAVAFGPGVTLEGLLLKSEPLT